MKEMLKTLGEQAERERAAESYIDGLFSKITQQDRLKSQISQKEEPVENGQIR